MPRRGFAVLHCGAALWAVGALAPRLAAQGAVRGQLRVIETPTGAPAVLTDAVIYLEADGDRLRGPWPTMAKASVGMRSREFVPRVLTAPTVITEGSIPGELMPP